MELWTWEVLKQGGLVLQSQAAGAFFICFFCFLLCCKQILALLRFFLIPLFSFIRMFWLARHPHVGNMSTTSQIAVVPQCSSHQTSWTTITLRLAPVTLCPYHGAEILIFPLFWGCRITFACFGNMMWLLTSNCHHLTAYQLKTWLLTKGTSAYELLSIFSGQGLCHGSVFSKCEAM